MWMVTRAEHLMDSAHQNVFLTLELNLMPSTLTPHAFVFPWTCPPPPPLWGRGPVEHFCSDGNRGEGEEGEGMLWRIKIFPCNLVMMIIIICDCR